MEALRLTHPLGQLVKGTGAHSQLVRIASRTVTLPPHTVIQLSLAAMHTHRTYWGPNPLAWDPRRFFSITHGASVVNERLQSDTQPHFLPWATGQRVCPGKKFSQVELVAALALLLRDHAVSPRPNKGETLKQAQRSILRLDTRLSTKAKSCMR